jgi:diguanylate cyclase (GGDEF)-like protein
VGAVEELMDAARALAGGPDPTPVLDQIDAALAADPTNEVAGGLHLARAIALQAVADPTDGAHAAREAVRYLRSTDDRETHSYAAAAGAVMFHRAGDVERCVELVVDATVQLTRAEPAHPHTLSATNCLAQAFAARSWQSNQDAPLAAQATQRAELELARNQLLGEADHLAREAAVDPVTGVGTRRWLELQLDELSRESSSVAAMMLDLDHFKNINDQHGHHLGDSVLATAGELLSSSVRRSDVVARYGGDEFVLLLAGAEEPKAIELAERIQGRFRSFEWADLADGLSVTPSIGIAHGQASALRDLLRLADNALYEAKTNGRDQARVASTQPS